MSRISFTSGLLTWDTWATDVHQWLALTDLTPAFDGDSLQTVSDVVATEATIAGYTRLPVIGEANTPDLGRWLHTADAPAWPALDWGEILNWVVLARDTGNDATDELLAAFGVDHTTDGTPFEPSITAGGILITRGAL